METISTATVVHIALTIFCQALAHTYGSHNGTLVTPAEATEIREKLKVCLHNGMTEAAACYRATVPADTPDFYRNEFFNIWASTLGGGAGGEWSDEIK